MADDHTQRPPYRTTDMPMRAAPAAAPQGSSSGDPLAELARLIGQNDPFAEFGREGGRRGAPPPPPAPPPGWNGQQANAGYPPQMSAPSTAPNFGANDYYGATAASARAPEPPFAPPPAPRQGYGNPPYAAAPDLYPSEHEAPDYAARQGGGYEAGAHYPNQMHLGADEDDLYDDVPPRRRRVAVLAIAAVFALAVIGTAGAFGYRALFGSSGSGGAPPVIEADASPSKIVPAAMTKDAQNTKMIYDRAGDRGQTEKIVSREENPVAMKDKPAGVMAQDTAQPPLGSGIVGMEPKKIHTIAIHPDQPAAAGAPPATAAKPPAHSTRVAATGAAPAADPPARQQVAATTATAPVRHAASQNAPLSLSPDVPPPPAVNAPPPATRSMRTASVPPPAQVAPAANTRTRSIAAGSTGAYAVQVSSQRSEAEAQTAFHSLQAKYPTQLGGRQPIIHRVDLGAKGIYFRAMVGPFASSSEAGELCTSLKTAGGSCIIQRN